MYFFANKWFNEAITVGVRTFITKISIKFRLFEIFEPIGGTG